MKLRSKKLFLIVFSLLLSACVICGAIPSKNVSANESNLTVKPLNGYYELNEVLDIPQGAFNVGGKSVPAVSTVSYPSGKYLYKTQVTLDEAGKYTVEYKAVVNGVLYAENKTFIVKSPLFSTETGSTVYYGAHEYAPDINGIVLELKNYDVFHFNKIIDLSNMTKDDTLFNMFFTPNIIGQNDVSQIDFTFTDIYNADNYITYTVKIYDKDNGIYSVAYANGQLPAGVEKKPDYNGSRPTMLIDGIKYVVHINNDYGTWSRIRFTGENESGLAIGKERLEVKFDYADKRFYTDQQCCPEVRGKAEVVVSDLDDGRLYSNKWNGFTDGKVFMTVSAKKYNAQTCNIVITDIAGENLAVDGIEDKTAPTITVNYGELSDGDKAPEGKINKAYRIFDCTVFDDYTKEPTLDTKVFYNYYSANKTKVDISDGAFIPKNAGRYTIEYTARDLFGNEQVKAVDVTVKDAAESLSFTLGNGATSARAGESVQVKGFAASSSISKYEVKIKAVNNDKSGVEYEIDSETLAFTPMYSGNYTITYVCSDYISSVSKAYTLQVINSNKTLILEDATALPKYFIKGCEYTLPELKAYNFSTGEPVKSSVEIYAKCGANGTYSKVASNRKYVVPQADKIYIKYSTSDDYKEYSVPVADVGYRTDSFDKGKYFVGTGFSSQSKSDMISYTSNSSFSSMEFINALLSDGFSMSFTVSALSEAFTGLDIYMTDIYDAEKTVKFHYYVENGTTYFKINDSSIYYDLEGKLGESQIFTIVYNAKKRTISPYNEKVIAIQEYLSGKLFEGFSEKVYLKVEMSGGSGTVFNLQTLNKQSMNNEKDYLAPAINYSKVEGYRGLNEIITISPAFAGDVLDPNVTFYLKVVDPNKKVVSDMSGERLEESYNTATAHKIKLSAYGTWNVYYYACDASGNEYDKAKFNIKVTDMQAPVIVVNPTQNQYSVNDEISVVAPVIRDDIDNNLSYSVLVYKPNSDLVVCEGNTFRADAAGEYVIYYYCADKSGNVGIASYSVRVR